VTAHCTATPPAPGGPDNRSHARRAVRITGRLFSDGVWQDCEVINVSAGGAKLHVVSACRPGQELRLEIELCGQLPGVAAWVRGDELGIKFTGDPAETAAALIGLATYG